jgi:hypothetical protein
MTPAIPDFHDGLLEGVTLSPEKTLCLQLRAVSGERWAIYAPNLRRLKADNFCEGNIIFEFNVYSGRDCPEALIKKLQGYSGENASHRLAGDLRQIADENWTLLEITSSYGCELLALSEANPDSLGVVELK